MANKNSWGGSWTEQKLNAFEKYVKAYLTIMHGTREKYNGWPQNIIYFDGFAGSGTRNNSEQVKEQPTIEGLDITAEEENIYKGSSERVLTLEKKFDKYILVDLDEDSLNNLQNQLSKKNIGLNSCKFISQDVNIVIKNFTNEFTKHDAALMLLDPFGMQVRWESIESLKNKRIDLWILLPSGVIINRLLDRRGELKNIQLLKENLGINEQEIQKEFYKTETQATLFGMEEQVNKISNAIHKISEIYVNKLKEIFKYVTDKPLELKNSRNVTIFHFIFASNNKAAVNIAGQIIDSTKKKSK